MPPILTAQDPLGFGRLAAQNLANRELSIREQEAGRRGQLQDIQIAQAQSTEQSRLTNLARQQQMQQGLSQALANIPEGENRFTVTHNFLQNNGFQTEAAAVREEQGKLIDRLGSDEAQAQLFNSTLGRVENVTLKATSPGDLGKPFEAVDAQGNSVFIVRDEAAEGGFRQVEGFAPPSAAAPAAGTTNLSKLIADRAALPEDDPNKRLFDAAIRKEVQPIGARETDKQAAQDFIDFRVKGGEADVKKGIDQLDDVVARLSSGRNLTGPVVGRTPDVILSATNPEAIDTRELVEEVVQRNLRVILGAQFTEKEGERLIRRAFNPRLNEATNLRRVTNLVNQMRVGLKARQAAADFFQANKTLEGCDGKLPSRGDFRRLNLDEEPERPIAEAVPAAATFQEAAGEVVSQGIQFLGFE